MVSVGLCIVSHDRPGELIDALRSAQGDSWNEILVLDMANDPRLVAPPGVLILRQDRNSGVVAGRNFLCHASKSDVLVFIDDDATFMTAAVEVVRTLFEERPTLAITAFEIRRPGGAIRSKEFPFRGRVRHPNSSRPSAYFIGAGYAARRSAVMAIGGYDEQIQGYGEELELSFRLIREGWELWYEPKVIVEHRPSPRGRTSVSPVNAIRHRVLVVRRYLPAPVAAVHLLLWTGLTLAQAARVKAVTRWWNALCEGFDLETRRQPLPWSRLVGLHRIGGRILW